MSAQALLMPLLGLATAAMNKPPKPPKPNPPARMPDPNSPDAIAARRAAEQERMAAGGRESTNLAGGRTPSAAPTFSNTALGQ